jgi:hypothetical protein
MYSINPGLAGALVDDHVTELRREAAGRATLAELPNRRSLRGEAGWLLVSLGLRLVLPRRSALRRSALRRSVLRRSVLRPAR